MGAVAAIAAAAGTIYNIQANRSMQRQAGHAADTANTQAALEIAERNRLTAEHTAAAVAEAERERALAISNQEAQNVRVNVLAAEAAASEKAIARNILERSQEEALITRQESAREEARIRDLQEATQGRQLAALAGSGVSLAGEGGTSGAILLDTKTRAGKDVGALKDVTTARMNLLEKQGSFALEQGEASAKNILESAEHATQTNIENVKAAGETLVRNAEIAGATDTAMANLQNLMTIGSASQFSQQVDRMRSEANARIWGSLLSSPLWTMKPKSSGSGTSGLLSNSSTGSENLIPAG